MTSDDPITVRVAPAALQAYSCPRRVDQSVDVRGATLAIARDVRAYYAMRLRSPMPVKVDGAGAEGQRIELRSRVELTSSALS